MLSIIFQIKNALKHLPFTFNPLFLQMNKEDKLYIIDYASLDGTGRDTFPSDPRIKFIREEKKSEPVILNEVISGIVEGHVLFLDANYAINNDYLKTLRALVKAQNVIVKGEEGSFISNACFPVKLLQEYPFPTVFSSNKDASYGAVVYEYGISHGYESLVSKSLKITHRGGPQRTSKNTEIEHIYKDKIERGRNQRFSGNFSVLTPFDDLEHLHVLKTLEYNEIISAKPLDRMLEKAKNDVVFIVLEKDIDKETISIVKELYDEDVAVVCSNDFTKISLSDHQKTSDFCYIMTKKQFINEDVMALRNIEARRFINVAKKNAERKTRPIVNDAKRVGPQAQKKTVKTVSRVPATREKRKRQPIVNKHVPSPEEIRNGYAGRKPKILLCTDVKGWAWWIKSQYLQKYLSDEFYIDIIELLSNGKTLDHRAYDLYLTYGYSYVGYLKKVPYHKRISGVTAHRPANYLTDPLNQVYAAHANSMLLLNELKALHKNTFYTPNGVDTDIFFPKVETPINEDVIFGHVGKLSPLKGQKEIIEPAIKKSKSKYVSHYNTHMDKIKYENMIDIYQKMDVFVVASDEDGTPCPALEAAACGRPIISNRIGNMPEFIKDGYNGFLVEKHIDAYVEKINWFKNNKDKIHEMGQNARKTAIEEWTWKIQAENYRRMFRTLLCM